MEVSAQVGATPATVTCTHPDCDRAATDVRGGFELCRECFFLALIWEQAAA